MSLSPSFKLHPTRIRCPGMSLYWPQDGTISIIPIGRQGWDGESKGKHSINLRDTQISGDKTEDLAAKLGEQREILMGHGHAHTVRKLRITLIEIVHPIRSYGMLGKGLDYVLSEYEQIPTSPLKEKWKKPPKIGFLATFVNIVFR